MMNRNQKIALGCGGAGCLGLIVVTVAVVILGLSNGWFSRSKVNRNYNFNSNSTRPTNADSNANSAPTSSSSISDDDKHKLFHAATVAGDSELLQRVLKKLGLFTAGGAPTDQYTEFAKDHFAWAMRNTDFIKSVTTPEEGRAYVNEHIGD